MDNMVYVMVLLNSAIGIGALAILAISMRINARVDKFITEWNKIDNCCWKYEEVKKEQKDEG